VLFACFKLHPEFNYTVEKMIMGFDIVIKWEGERESTIIVSIVQGNTLRGCGFSFSALK
jgi:hypothetical protein